ncbi:glycoside hydrolase family 16 protein [Plicaturopsis crispa FD-325 SS-3]|nr:glycoside hydrolase family 16 protein [Plicaturopsis crispa FD-325 SS-3]
MHLHLPLGLIIFLLVHIAPASAGGFPRVARDTLGRATRHVHRVALKHSAGLARDLRVALGGVLVSQQPINSGSSNRIYCVVGSNPSSGSGTGTNGTSPATPSGTTTALPSGSATATSSSAKPTATSPFKLVESHQGSNFFDGWTFDTGSDPTHGTVNYVDQQTAQSSGLASVNSAGHAVMSVETTPTVQSTRNSVRITTNSNYNNGALVLMDSVHMPTGCATWPAWWMNGPNWPAGGEIDIVEGVNNYTNNQATIHTSQGCSMGSSSSATLAITGSVVGGTDCSAADSGNQGCGVRSADSTSFGAPFNQNGGGVYAMNWDSTGIKIYFFSRASIPADITAGAPVPSGWGTPMGHWPAGSCDPFKFFSDISAIFDTTLCGDWAGSAWGGTGIPGQEQSCAQRTGFSTCEAFVQASGASFSEAYWEVDYVKIFQAA